MKIHHYTFLILSFLITSCSVKNNDSTTISDDSSTSFVKSLSSSSNPSNIESNISSSDEHQEVKIIQSQTDLNKLNQNVGLTPSIGNTNILLIPIHFEDIQRPEFNVEKIQTAFNGKSNELEWYSVSEFYNLSSYGNLNLSFTLTDVFTPSKPSTYYETNYTNYNYVYAVEEIITEALEYFDETYNYNDFDSNDDGFIDGIYLIYDHPVDFLYETNLWWAFTYYFANEQILFDNMKIKSYVFAGYDFMSQNDEQCNTHTYIHETAHMFGIDDYYDYNTSLGSNVGGLAGGDIMDGTIGDHNAFTKAILGWTNGHLVQPEDSLTIKLSSFQKNGDFIILTNSYDDELGYLQEYFILEYYTPTKLQEYDKIFQKNGLRILHIVANCKKNGTLKYNNTDTNVKLISQITSSDGSTYISSTTQISDETLFFEGETLNKVKYSNGSYLSYIVSIDEIQDEEITITIQKR